MDHAKLEAVLRDAALEAGKVIMEIYDSPDFGVETKADDSPVTKADLAADEVIRAALTEAGFDPNLANSGLLVGAEQYAANLEEAVGLGVFGSPFYIVDGTEKFWGQDRLDDLDLFLSGKL